MGENTKIEWAHHTFNPWVGCTKVSFACDNCYAEGWAKRTGQSDLWQGNRRRTADANWRQPLKWNRQAEAKGVRYRVFCASLADVFDNQVPEIWRSDLFELIEETPALDWLLLTKRPQNIAKMIWPKWDGGLPRNIWLGTTVENQTEAERRIPHLLAVPAAVYFLSCEPLLGPIDLRSLCYGSGKVLPPAMRVNEERCSIDALRGVSIWPGSHYISPLIADRHEIRNGELWTRNGHARRIDWVIAGGESGPGSRLMLPDWARSLRNQCSAAGVAFHFKQWGEFTPDDPAPGAKTAMRHVGKRAAGRLLDGVEHDGFPEVRA
ncbi:phage Gp37/Gp68 family protein [Labrys sp. La1]|uniref:phage Gp37/Gp68 family protein n=1 Tax=Labrys sp. La1 TaxID=3404917 RepID=UPI003EBF7D08